MYLVRELTMSAAGKSKLTAMQGICDNRETLETNFIWGSRRQQSVVYSIKFSIRDDSDQCSRKFYAPTHTHAHKPTLSDAHTLSKFAQLET